MDPLSSMLRVDADRVWTADDLDALPEDLDWRRFEIVDGALVVSPHATPRHDLVVAELIRALAPGVPAGYRVLGSVMVDLHPSYRVPDVTVVAEQVFRTGVSRITAADVLLAVEIESPSSVTTDRITKPAQYAAAGIEHYWRVESDPLRLHAYQLSDGIYASAGAWGPGGLATTDTPVAAVIDLQALLPD